MKGTDVIGCLFQNLQKFRLYFFQSGLHFLIRDKEIIQFYVIKAGAVVMKGGIATASDIGDDVPDDCLDLGGRFAPGEDFFILDFSHFKNTNHVEPLFFLWCNVDRPRRFSAGRPLELYLRSLLQVLPFGSNLSKA